MHYMTTAESECHPTDSVEAPKWYGSVDITDVFTLKDNINHSGVLCIEHL